MVNMILSGFALFSAAIIGGLLVGYFLRAVATREYRREVEAQIEEYRSALGYGASHRAQDVPPP